MERNSSIDYLGVQPTPYNDFLFEELSHYYDVRKYFDRMFVKNLEFGQTEKRNLLTWTYVFRLLFGHNLPDLIIISGFKSWKKILILLVCRLRGLNSALWTDTINPKRYKGLRGRLKLILFSFSKHVLTTGEIGIKNLVAVGAKNVYNFPFVVKTSRGDCSKIVMNTGVIELLLVSRLVKRKGILETIDSLEEYTRLRSQVKISLTICGDGPLKNSLVERSSVTNDSFKVIVKGWIDNEKMRNLMDEADYLIHLPSEHDPYPLVVLEALASRLPVISNSFAGSAVSEIIDGINGHIFDGGSEIDFDSCFNYSQRKYDFTNYPKYGLYTCIETINSII